MRSAAVLVSLLLASVSAQNETAPVIQNGTVPAVPPEPKGPPNNSVTGGAGGDAVGECAAPLQKFVGCVKAEVAERELAEAKEAGGELKDKLAACFTAEGCTPPDFGAPIDGDLKAESKENWANLSEWWGSTDSDKRYCVISEIRGNFRQKLQECVAKSIPGFDIAPSRDEKKLSAEDKAQIKKVAEHRFRLHVALRKCGVKEKSVQECMRKERNVGVFTESCATRKKCAADVSADCQKIWIDRIRSTVCGCVTETAELLRKNIVTDANGLPLKDDAIKTKCGVDLPNVNVPSIRNEPELHSRIKDYVALHEDRRISICHDCDGVPL